MPLRVNSRSPVLKALGDHRRLFFEAVPGGVLIVDRRGEVAGQRRCGRDQRAPFLSSVTSTCCRQTIFSFAGSLPASPRAGGDDARASAHERLDGKQVHRHAVADLARQLRASPGAARRRRSAPARPAAPSGGSPACAASRPRARPSALPACRARRSPSRARASSRRLNGVPCQFCDDGVARARRDRG